jgi:hypothetical protein
MIKSVIPKDVPSLQCEGRTEEGMCANRRLRWDRKNTWLNLLDTSTSDHHLRNETSIFACGIKHLQLQETG